MPVDNPAKQPAPRMDYSQVKQAVTHVLNNHSELDNVVRASVERLSNEIALEVTANLTTTVTEHLSEIDSRVQSTFDAAGSTLILQRDQMAADIDTRMAAIEAAHRHTVVINDRATGETRELEGLVHQQFPVLLKLVQNGNPTILTGPTQSAKSFHTERAAEVLGLRYYFHSFGPTQTETALSGFVNASGEFSYRSLYLAVKYGGVWVGDEMDVVRDAGVLIWMNNGISNGTWSFPPGAMTAVLNEMEELGQLGILDEANRTRLSGGQIKSHKDLRILATMNTAGRGSDMTYVGRGRLDPSTLARFDFLHWPYDESLERALVAQRAPSERSEEWVTLCQAVRAVIEEEHMSGEIIVSPSSTMRGAKLLAAGIPWDDAIKLAVLTVAVDDDKREQLLAKARARRRR